MNSKKLEEAREAMNSCEPAPILVAGDRVIITKDCYNKLIKALSDDSKQTS